jgi:hypothetical protein
VASQFSFRAQFGAAASSLSFPPSLAIYAVAQATYAVAASKCEATCAVAVSKRVASHAQVANTVRKTNPDRNIIGGIVLLLLLQSVRLMRKHSTFHKYVHTHIPVAPQFRLFRCSASATVATVATATVWTTPALSPAALLRLSDELPYS